MTHKEFISEVQKVSGLDKQVCATLLSATVKLLAEEGTEQIPVEFEGLGTFVATKHPEYIEENPETHVVTLYPPRISYRFQSQMEL
ncbi:MAG: HU family DNA-binding protein [Bacteroidales bacterium]|nr:HU family DNA-binding protein [Bacteroidales bacterium]MBO7379159.1 HU family DNA-binding protein [Bacteroidales bacterium]MBP5213716.1 HU family DNA-binding protein [Bacteroidales bacterium]